MRTPHTTSAFRRDWRRLSKSGRLPDSEHAFRRVVEKLLADEPLPTHNHDHRLRGQRRGERECHVQPDLILIYRKPDEQVLELVRIGSHSQLRL